MDNLDIDSFEFCRNGMQGFRKGPMIIGYNGNTGWPLCYLRKPKHLTENEWKRLLDMLKIKLLKG